MHTVLTEVDTRDVPAPDRFALWLDLISRTGVPVEVGSEHAADFIAMTRMLDLGVLRVAMHEYPPLEAHRTPSLIRRRDPNLCQIVLNLRGTLAVAQCRRTTKLAVNEFTMLDSSLPFHASHLVHSGKHGGPAAITVQFSRSLLPVSAGQLGPLNAESMPGQDGIGALLKSHLRELTQRPGEYLPTDAARLGTVTLDLLVAMLAHHLDSETALAPKAQEQAMLLRIHSYVERNLDCPSLSPQMIADQHHISTRTLHRLFHDHGATVAGWIRTRRLERCRHDLAEALQRDRSITAIATRWGFTDSAHFSRAFRAQFGMSPQSFRRQQQGSAKADDADRQ